MSTTPPPLWPAPQLAEWSDGFVDHGTTVVETHGASLPPEGYELVVGEDISLAYADDNGLRYGRQTLAQMTGVEGVRRGRIADHPDIAVRGHMLDISRDRVPTRETLSLLVERLRKCRYNHLQLYTEHAFAYADHQVVWTDASPLTPGDVLWLDQLCADNGIELVANQNTFGHMERWLAHDDYRARAESPDGFDFLGVHRGPAALAPTQANADFALGLVRELLPNFSSNRINIGCDEIFELGQGASSADVAARGKPAVFVEHLRRIAEPLLADGYRVQFWADMVQAEPAAARSLADAGAVAAIWGYQAPLDIDPATIDYDAMPASMREIARDYLEVAAAGFGPRAEAFAVSGFSTWLVPGTSGWNTFGGNHRNASGNIADAVEVALRHGVEGVLITEWGDGGHQQPPFATMPAMAYGGAAMWCFDQNGACTDDELIASVSRILFADASESVARAQVLLGTVGDTLRAGSTNGWPYFYHWVGDLDPGGGGDLGTEALHAALAQVDEAVLLLESAASVAVDGTDLVADTVWSAQLIGHGLRRMGAAQGLLDLTAEDLVAEYAFITDAFEGHWLRRSRPGGMDDSRAKLRPPD